MKEILKRIFVLKEVVWPPFLPIVIVPLSIFINVWLFLIGPIISIIFYSLFAFEIHNIDLKKRNTSESDIKKSEIKKPSWEFLGSNKLFVYNQYWLNGLGALVGWLALYILLFHIIDVDQCNFSTAISTWVKNLRVTDFVLVALAFLGLTGNIPYYALLGKGSDKG